MLDIHGPCTRDCPDRRVSPTNCHDTCEAFLEYKKKVADINKKIRDGKAEERKGVITQKKARRR